MGQFKIKRFTTAAAEGPSIKPFALHLPSKVSKYLELLDYIPEYILFIHRLFILVIAAIFLKYKLIKEYKLETAAQANSR